MDRAHVVSPSEWRAARLRLLAEEKELTRRRDEVAAARRALPMVRIDASYAFAGPDGQRTLAELFADRRQLIVYHFMFDPGWSEGCRICSLFADTFDGAIRHLATRDTAFAAVSRAPVATLMAFRGRMGWTFPWYSSGASSFNYDFRVSFTPEEVASGNAEYNYAPQRVTADLPGLSVFLREGDEIFHTYSTYARGLDPLMATYGLLDLTPLGRHEDELPHPMAWIRHHDRYTSA